MLLGRAADYARATLASAPSRELVRLSRRAARARSCRRPITGLGVSESESRAIGR